MIHRLRRRHRLIWLALAVLLPLLYAIGLAVRPPAPLVESLPEPLRAVSTAAGREGSSDAGRGGELGV